MKKTLLTIAIALVLGLSFNTGYAQKASNSTPSFEVNKNTPTISFQTPDLEKIKKEDAENDAKGMRYRIGVGTQTMITPSNAGLWTTAANGDRVWQLKISYPGAEALSFMFSKFILDGRSTMDVLSLSGEKLHKTYGSADVLDHGQQNMSLCYADEVVLQLVEPVGAQSSEVVLDEIMFGYRGTGNPNVAKINESDDCEVNVNCSEGTNWQDEKRSVARILVSDSGFQGWCTGALVNNLNQDCKPYFLTALHCGVTASTANFNQWRFYFGYEAVGCTSPSTAGTLDDHFITGCVKLATSNDNGGDSGSDFLLVQMGSVANEATTVASLKSASFNAYWAGWDANNTTSSSGVSIHHPAGDIKKISTYSSNLVSTQWGSASGSHWRVTWVSSTNGHGVTEGGSSGSPIFNFNGGNSRIIGTLTGGSSYCNSVQPGGQDDPDLYGKMSFHWTSNGTPTNERLKTYLDPNNTGTLVLNGSNNPCSASAGIEEFENSNLTIYPNPTSSVITIDLSKLENVTEVAVYDLTGKLMYSAANINGSSLTIDLSDFSKGMYQAIISTERMNITQKIVKQ